MVDLKGTHQTLAILREILRHELTELLGQRLKVNMRSDRYGDCIDLLEFLAAVRVSRFVLSLPILKIL